MVEGYKFRNKNSLFWKRYPITVQSAKKKTQKSFKFRVVIVTMHYLYTKQYYN